MEKNKYKGKVALVTGASRGLGFHMARVLAYGGATVICMARTVGGLEELDDRIREDDAAQQTGGTAVLVPADLRQLEMLDSLAFSLADRFGKLDYFIANAGVLGAMTPVSDITNKNWQEAFTVNVEAHFRLLRALHPLLLRSEAGKVLTITSSRAHRPEPFWGLFSATKAAWESLLRTYGQEVSMTPIRVFFADPVEAPTNLWKSAYPGKALPEDESNPLVEAAAIKCLKALYPMN